VWAAAILVDTSSQCARLGISCLWYMGYNCVFREQTQGSLEARLWISCVDVETRFTVVGLLCLTREERLKNGCCLYLIEALTLRKILKEGFIKRSYPPKKIQQNTNINCLERNQSNNS
jgi:hypothetical protein